MAEVLPKIRVTDSQSRDAAPPTAASTNSPAAERPDPGKVSRPRSRQEGPVPNGKNPSVKVRPIQISTSPGAHPAGSIGKNDSPTSLSSPQAIDPLSKHILDRTSGPNNVPLKHRTQQDNGSPLGLNIQLDPLSNVNRQNTMIWADGPGSNKDKKKGVSFLSRFMGAKRKGTTDSAYEDGSETSESRPEGTDAQLFSQTFDNLGFSPRHPQPPAYIKVRSKFKKENEFNRVFLAQELKAPPAPDDLKRKVTTSPSNTSISGIAARSNPIWALEFSKDGKYLATGGQDKIVRVWSVISTSEERRIHEKEEAVDVGADGQSMHLSAPVFQRNPFREYEGHTATVLDLSWSKNNFLLSSSMDRTVRLWHTSRPECLCTFKHTDFVPSIQFHPRDDRFFLAGSLDMKLRLWSIPDKSVAFWNQLPDMVTAVSFTPDGKTAIAGTLNGLCLFYETEGLKYQTQIHVKSNHGRNAKGSKITGIQAVNFPPSNTNGEVKLLISSNDSRIRLYNLRDKSLEFKFKAHENNQSQIHASFSDDATYIICGSEDRKAYIWSSGPGEGDKRNQHPVEMFEAHNTMTTCAILAPTKTRQLLSASEDPLYDLCNPPPVTLVSRAESVYSSRAPTEAGSAQPTPAPTETAFKRVEESPAYIARSAHPDGNIIITADYTGSIKVFRQDCAFQKRLKSDPWETSSAFSRRVGSGMFSPRPNSITGRASNRTRRDSTSTQPPSDRILSWRQDIASNASVDNLRATRRDNPRSASPHKSLEHRSTASGNQFKLELASLPASDTTIASANFDKQAEGNLTSDANGSPPSNAQKLEVTDSENPSMAHGGQTWSFWNPMLHIHHHSKSSQSQLQPPKTSRSAQGSVASSDDGEMQDALTSIHSTSRRGSGANSSVEWNR